MAKVKSYRTRKGNTAYGPYDLTSKKQGDRSVTTGNNKRYVCTNKVYRPWDKIGSDDNLRLTIHNPPFAIDNLRMPPEMHFCIPRNALVPYLDSDFMELTFYRADKLNFSNAALQKVEGAWQWDYLVDDIDTTKTMPGDLTDIMRERLATNEINDRAMKTAQKRRGDGESLLSIEGYDTSEFKELDSEFNI